MDSPNDYDTWSYLDLAAMLNAEPPSETGGTPGIFVEPSGGFHPDEGNIVIDPDYYDILGMSDPDELIRRKDSISK